MLTADRIRRFAPRARADMVNALVTGWPMMRDEYHVDTPLRLQHFMAQIAAETGGFEIVQENMNYSAERMTQVWPSRFPTIDTATPYAHNPTKLANYVYGNRMGNRPGTSDGWDYRGRGFLQTTGREGYRAAGHENDPDALLDPSTSLKAALIEWQAGGCNKWADQDDVKTIRRIINGGYNGIDDARAYLSRGKTIFLVDSAPAAPAPEPKPPAFDAHPTSTAPKANPAPAPAPSPGGFIAVLLVFVGYVATAFTDVGHWLAGVFHHFF